MGRQGPYGPGTQEKVANTQRSIRSVLSLLSFEGIGSYLEAGPCGLRTPGLDRRQIFEFTESHWAYSSVGLEHTPDKREVGSSNLPRPTTYR